MKFTLILLISMVAGFLALSQEIIWIRILMYSTGGLPQVFAYVLGSYLTGIAFGSWWARKLCSQNVEILLISKMFFFSSIIFYLALGLTSYFYTIFNGAVIYVFVGIVTIFTGAIFPLISHFGIKSKNIGQHLSLIYLFNIIGATLGSAVTGFYLMEHFPTIKIINFILISGLLASLIISFFSHDNKKKKIYFAFTLVSILSVYQIHDEIFSSFLEKIHFNNKFVKKGNYKYLKENRSGIIATHFDEDINCDVIYGGGVYDSCFNVEPDGPNGIERVYAIVKLHPYPKNILVIGLSSGSWVRALSYSKVFQTIDVVEINDGYLDLIKKYPEHAKIFEDPRISIHIDDGRKWLTRSNKKYDFILMNTTFHWRSYVSNLVSTDFLNLAKANLNSNGIIYYNATGSEDIIFTAAKNFNHVVRFGSFVAASDSPIGVETETAQSFASSFMNGDNQILTGSRAINKILSNELPNIRQEILTRKDLFEITDDNMAVEYKKHFSRYFNPELSWLRMFERLL